MSIGEIATKPAVYCLPTNTIEHAARAMREHDVGCLVVVDLDQRPIGLVTDRDLVVRGIASGRPVATPIDSVMSHDLVSISADRDPLDAATHMATRGCRRLPVVDDAGKLVGIVTFDDLLARTAHTIDELTRVVSVEHAEHTAQVGGARVVPLYGRGLSSR